MMSEYRRAEKQIEVTPGESVKTLRELQGMSQNDLASESGISQSTVSAIERNLNSLDVERAHQLARVLKCHPAVLVFPGWDIKYESVA